MPSLEEDTESELRALVGTTVSGKYRVDRLIGRGGMGAVFQAANLAIGKRVALKFLGHEAAQNLEACQRFQREAEAASLAESAHIVQIFDSGVSDSGLPFLVMELLTGEDLRARLRREQRLSVESALRIVSQVLRALVRAHEAGIIHRDLKPDNLFLCARDDDPSFVKIVDFGISKLAHARIADTLTRRGTVLGTAFYMSPEQAQSFPDIDARSDLFSLGAILFEMLCGSPPQVLPTYEGVLIAICTRDAVDVRTQAPHVPEAVAVLLQRALARERSQRFQSATEFLSALAQVQQSLEPGASSQSVSGTEGAAVSLEAAPSAAPQRSRRLILAGIAASLCGFALTAYWVASSGPHAELETASAAPAAGGRPAAVAVASSPALVPSAPLAGSARVVNPGFPAPVLSRIDKPRRPVPPKPSAHVAGGLQLSTKEP